MNALEIKDLRFRYADGKEALRGISFTVPEGESVGLIGPNGAGKSTLLLHLNGLLPEEPARQPAVTVFGRLATADNLPAIRREVGLLFQDADDQIFCPTVYEDVAFGPEQLGLSDGEVKARVKRALEQVGLAGFEDRAAHRLSGGEKRRVCLAGVLACDSRILVLDEPTGGLDPRGRQEFKALLRRIPATRIIATHDLDMVAELCDRAIVLDGGEIVADGAAWEILANEELMLAHGLEKPHALLHREGHIPPSRPHWHGPFQVVHPKKLG